MKNEYEIRGDVTAIFLKSKRFGDMETIISTSKLAKMNEFPNTWVTQWNEYTKSFYAVGAVGGRRDRKRILMHSFLTECPKGFVTDHENNNTLDNTDKNLRVLSYSENGQNRRGLNSTNKSGVRNVSWVVRDQRWRVSFPIDGKQKVVGHYKELSEAARVANEMRLLHMPFAK